MDVNLYAGAPEQTAAEHAEEVAQARRLAERYRLPYLDSAHFNIDHDLFRTIPAELMLRYGFVPFRRDGQALVIVVSDPTDLPMIDELAMLLGMPIKVMVAAPSAIQSILRSEERRVGKECMYGGAAECVTKDGVRSG